MSMGSYSGRAYYCKWDMGELSSGGGGGIMEFYCILLSGVMLCLADSFWSLRYELNMHKYNL